MRREGFVVQVREVSNINDVKARVGVALAKGSGHTDAAWFVGHGGAGRHMAAIRG